MADKLNTRKRKHETLSLAAKIEILRKLDSGQNKVKLAEEYNVGRATIYDIKKNRQKIESFVKNIGIEANSRQTLRQCEYLLMEDMLFSWFLEERRHNRDLSEKVIKKQSLHFYKEIYKNDNFKASDGWFRNFKTRYGIKGLYDPVIRNSITKTMKITHKSKQKFKEDSASHSKTYKYEESELNVSNIVPKTEIQDEAADVERPSRNLAWPDETSEDGSCSDSQEKSEENSEYEDLSWKSQSEIFFAHLKTRMDNLDHQQRFIAQKLMSDVIMLAEANQLHLTSAIVNRVLKKNRHKTSKGNDPLLN